MPATATLPALLALFKIDRDLQALRVGLDNVQKDQRRQQAKIAALQADHDARDLANKRVMADQSTRELEIKTRQEHIEKARGTLNTSKTNKEYSAVLVLISAEKAEVSKLEQGVLELMQQVETASKEVTQLKEQIVAEQATLAKIESEQAGKVSDLQSQIDALSVRRAEAAQVVPASVLTQYERVSQKHPGDALAPLEWDESDLDSVSCGSCFMGLNVEHLNALRSRDEVRRCNSCNRILYLPDMLAKVAT